MRDKLVAELIIFTVLGYCFGGGYALAFALGCFIELCLEVDV